MHRYDQHPLLSRRNGARPEDGVALVGTLVGFAIVMMLLLLAVQVVLRLYATSVVGSVATRAAESVASAADPVSAVAGAEAAARASLGSYGSRATTFTWSEVDAMQVTLTVRAPGPEVLSLPGWGDISRTVTVRTEHFR